MVGQDFFSPCNDGVHNLAVFGDLSCRVEVREPSQRLIRAVEVFGFVQPVELLERVPSGSAPGMSVEQPIQMRLVAVAEMVSSAEEGEAGSEQVRLVYGRSLIRGPALHFPPYQSEAFGEPARHMEAVEDVAGVGQVLGDGRLE